MTHRSTRRDILEGIVGLSVATVVAAYALPIGLDKMAQVAPGGLTIESGETALISSSDDDCYDFIEWEQTGVLEIEQGGQVCVSPV